MVGGKNEMPQKGAELAPAASNFLNPLGSLSDYNNRSDFGNRSSS